MKRSIFISLIFLFTILLNVNSKNRYVYIKTINDLNIYYPNYKRIDLVCGKMPLRSDKNILMMCEAAFTGAPLQREFSHEKIAGNHASGGKFYRGYTCRRNTGAFVYYDGQWKFLLDDYASEIEKAASHGGMGFGQCMIIHNGVSLPLWRKNTNYYRALCELDGKLCVIDSKNRIPYADFVHLLEKTKVRNALYLDMGTGWNFSWYRDAAGIARLIHRKYTIYATNWIVFEQ